MKRIFNTFIILCIGFTGCALPVRTIQPAHNANEFDDVRFTHYLATLPTVTVDEGTRAVLQLIGPTKQWPTFEDRWSKLVNLGAAKSTWQLKPDQILDQGTLAYMLRTLCKLEPGINESLATLTGWGDRRYALKTCIFEKLLPYTLPHHPVTGGEMVSALTRAEQFLPEPDLAGRNNP